MLEEFLTKGGSGLQRIILSNIKKEKREKPSYKIYGNNRLYTCTCMHPYRFLECLAASYLMESIQCIKGYREIRKQLLSSGMHRICGNRR